MGQMGASGAMQLMPTRLRTGHGTPLAPPHRTRQSNRT